MNKITESINGLKTFVEEVKVELLKCSWPTRQELMDSSVVVIVSVFIFGIFVFACDLVSQNVINFFIR